MKFKQLTYEEVKYYIEVESQSNYKLLSKTYINNHTDLELICNNNHLFLCSLKKFKEGSRCKICNPITKYTIPMIKNIFEENNCILLSTTYKNTRQLLDYICECGNTSKISLHDFLLGVRCPICAPLRRADKTRTPFEEIKKIFIDANCELLSNESEYENIFSEVKYCCSCGNKDATIKIVSFKQGQRCTKCQRERTEATCMLKYGTPNPLMNEDIKFKIRETLYLNGSTPSSIPQRYIYYLIGGELNYPVKTISLDIAFPDEMIYLEYDGGLHDAQVKFGNMTQKEFDSKERKRTYALLNSGWKEIRIISRDDRLPSGEIIFKMINYAKNYLSTGHHYIKFDIDNNLIITSKYSIFYDYGEIKRIKLPKFQEAI